MFGITGKAQWKAGESIWTLEKENGANENSRNLNMRRNVHARARSKFNKIQCVCVYSGSGVE